jgi:hypothetical protein
MSNPETLLLQRADEEMLKKSLEELPAEFREAMVLREIEEMPGRWLRSSASLARSRCAAPIPNRSSKHPEQLELLDAVDT